MRERASNRDCVSMHSHDLNGCIVVTTLVSGMLSLGWLGLRLAPQGSG